MAATVTLTVEQLQDLLQGQTAQLEQMMTTQIAALQWNLEKSFEEKLQAKFEAAEENVKLFMKESMEDPAEDETSKVTQELQSLKDQLCHMEQSVSRFVGSKERELDTAASPLPPINRPTNPSHSPTSVSVNTQTTHMENLVKDCCVRLEEIVQQKTAKWEQQPPPPPSPQTTRGPAPRRTKSMDGGSSSAGTVSVFRASQQRMEDLIETRFKAMEQFIDNRHAELEAYYSSSNDTLKKIFLEIVQGIPSSNSMRSNNGGSFSSIGPGHALTREELVAVLDDRRMAEKANGTRPITKDELEAILDARIHDDDEMDTPKPLTREELEAVLDARINAVEEEEEEVKRALQSQDPAESSSSHGGKSLHSAMEKLILHVKELIEIHSSTEDLEHQIQSKLDQLEAAEKGPSNFQRLEAKLESIEKLVLASIGTSPRKKQRSSSKKPSKKLSQIIPDKDAPNDDTTTKAQVEDSSRRHENAGATTNRASNAYSDVSVDEEGLDDSEEKVEEKQAGGGDRVKNFMNTLTNWRHLNDEQHGVRDRGVAPTSSSEDKRDEGDRGAGAPSDIDEGDDDIDSMDMSVDSSDGEGDEDNKVMELLLRLEAKLDQLREEKNRNHDDADHATLPPLEGIHPRERSTNARHSREIVLNTDSISESIREEHSKLKQWIMEQQDEMMNSDRQSEIARGDPQRAASDSLAGTTSVDTKVLQSIQEKLDSIENAVSTNQSLLQELRRQGVPEVPKELPMLEPLGGNGTVNLERKILSHLDNMDKSVQFKLDEIYREMQPTASRRDSDWSAMSTEDQSAIVSAIKNQLQEIKEAIIEHLRESIPDYEMAKSVLSENLEELREIVSEVAISEVELLKTQLGVAEESEQEALHAIVVLREQLEEAREAERRALYMPRAAPQPQSPERAGNVGLWNLGPFGQLLGQQLSAPPRQQKSRRFSTGQQSHASGLTHHSASRGLNYNSSITSNANKFRSPKQKLEDWKNQISDLDEKATDLRMLYSQLRGQQPGEWMEHGRLQLPPDFGAGNVAMQSSAGLGAGETKEMEVEVKVEVEMEPQGSSDGEDGGDWI
jgi:hypothetical protein